MKVLIDNQIYESQKFGGISRYFNELSLENDLIKKMELYPKKVKKNKPFYKKVWDKIHKKIFTNNQSVSKKNDFYNLQLSNLEYDLFHPTYYNNYFLNNLKTPFVLTVHDMIHEKYAEYFGISLDSIKKRRLCEKAAKIIAVSKTTKKDLIDIFNIQEDKIQVIYHATNFNALIGLKPDINLIGKSYILFTGNRGLYKNFFTFLIAVSTILKENRNLRLICSGPTFNDLEKRWINDLDLEDKVISYFCETDRELVYLYKNAECFVFPSLYEGFGFPILEAFACNCPIVASKGSSLEEVAGNAAVYFNPKDIKEMKQSIQLVLTDDSLKKKLIALGKERLKYFSWDKCRKETNALYKSVLDITI